MPGKRRAAFEAYYKANPDKLKGKSIDEAYAAMRRNVIATGDRAAKTSGDPIRNAVQRRVEKRVSPLAKGAAAITSLPGRAVKALPDPGFGSNQRGGNKSSGLPSIWKAGETRSNKSKLSDSQLAALERRLKNKSSKGGRSES